MSIILKLLRWLAIGALVGLLAFGAYLAGTLIWRNWALSVLVCYFGIGFVIFGIGLYVFSRNVETDVETSVLVGMGRAGLESQSTISRWRTRIAARFLVLCQSLAWPSMVIKISFMACRGYYVRSHAQAFARRVLDGDDITIEPWTMLLCLILASIALHVSEQPKIYFYIFAWAVWVYTVSLCMSIIIAPGSLAQRARRAEGAPRLRALQLALSASLLSLLSVTVIFADGPVTGKSLIDTATAMYSQLDSVQSILAGQRVSTRELISGLMGAILASAALQGLLSLKDFEREDNDLLFLADQRARLGKHATALSALERIKTPTVNSLMVKALCLIAVDQRPRAIEEWKKKGMLEGKESAWDPTKAREQLLQVMNIYPIPEPYMVAFLRDWLAAGPTPLSVSTITFGIKAFKRISIPKLLRALNDHNATGELDIVKVPLLVESGDVSSAQELLEKLPQQVGALDYLASFNWLLIGLAGPTSLQEDAVYFEKWCAENGLDSTMRVQ